MARIRKVCRRKGHDFGGPQPIVFEFCQRWWCEGARVSPTISMIIDDGFRASLERVIDQRGVR